MRVKLKVLNGKNRDAEINVTDSKFRIGRDDDCQIRLRTESVSRRHCELIRKDGALYVRDLKSRNGTFVNDGRVEKPKRLKMGDVLSVGKLKFEVLLEQSTDESKQPAFKGDYEAAEGPVESRPKNDQPATDSDIAGWFGEHHDTLNDSLVEESNEQADTQPFVAAESDTSEKSKEQILRELKEQRRKGAKSLPKDDDSGPTGKDSHSAATESLRNLYRH